MRSATACSTRLTLFTVAAAIVCFFVVAFSSSDFFSQATLDIAHKAHDKWDSVTNGQSSSSSPPKVYNCEDPYRRPGYLYIDQEDYKKTRWIPYTTEFLDAETPDSAEYPVPAGKDVYFNVTEVESAFTNSTSTPRQWMQMAVAEDERRRAKLQDVVEMNQQTPDDFITMKDEGDLGWLWGRRVLILGDSVDRFMIQFFCDEMGRKMKQPREHTTATCTIPTMNLTLVHWHYAGGWNYHPDWWWMTDMKKIPFEERWEALWAPLMETTVRGPEGRPDLMLWQNGLWDQRALWEAAEAHYDVEEPLGQRGRQLVWEEIRFVAARTKKLLKRLQEEFPEVPTMFRAITVHRESDAKDANIYELDRLSRAIAEQAGHEMFEWARIIAGFSMLYKDQTHPGKGAASWLWADMTLDYLARSAGIGDKARSPYFDGWDACHSHLTGWGGR